MGQLAQAALDAGGHVIGVIPRALADMEVAHTGLPDLRSWPDTDRPRIIQVVVVPVPANEKEPAHEHGDLRFVLATDRPDEVVAESMVTRDGEVVNARVREAMGLAPAAQESEG